MLINCAICSKNIVDTEHLHTHHIKKNNMNLMNIKY